MEVYIASARCAPVVLLCDGIFSCCQRSAEPPLNEFDMTNCWNPLCASLGRLTQRWLVILALAALLMAGCASPPPNKATPSPSKPQSVVTPPSSGALSEKAKKEQQQAIHKIRLGTLKQLYKLKPSAQAEIEQAAGYGVFEINGLNAVLVGKHGRGVVLDRSGRATYMQLARTDTGPGTAVQPCWQILVFRDAQRLKQFVNSGSPVDVSSDPGISLYHITANGVSNQADGAAQYFRDPSLN